LSPGSGFKPHYQSESWSISSHLLRRVIMCVCVCRGGYFAYLSKSYYRLVMEEVWSRAYFNRFKPIHVISSHTVPRRSFHFPPSLSTLYVCAYNLSFDISLHLLHVFYGVVDKTCFPKVPIDFNASQKSIHSTTI